MTELRKTIQSFSDTIDVRDTDKYISIVWSQKEWKDEK